MNTIPTSIKALVKQTHKLLVIVSLVVFSSSGFAAVKTASSEVCVEVIGSALPSESNISFARQMAIRDGLRQASMKNNVKVKVDQSVENYELKLDSARFSSQSKVKSFVVLDEGYEDAEDIYGQTKKGPLNYQVTMKVCLTEAIEACETILGNSYQARLAIAPVVMPHPDQARDISNLLIGYQQELDRRINNKNYKNFTLVNELIDLQPNQMVSPNLDSEQLSTFRDKTGAQFLLLTVIRSLSSHADRGSFKNSVKRFYNLEVKPDSRHIEIDWYLVDLINKKQIHQARAGFDVEGDVFVGRDRPFGSNGFFSTNTGKVFHALLNQQVTDVIESLRCKTFQSEIIDKRGGDYIIYLNADSGAKVGDDLAVYHRTGTPVRHNGIELGSDYQPGAFLKIKRIAQRFAVAEITANKGTVQVGDIVQAW